MALAVDLDSLRQFCAGGLCVLLQRDARIESFWTGSIGLRQMLLNAYSLISRLM